MNSNRPSFDDIRIELISQIPSFVAGETLALTSGALPLKATNRTTTYEIVTQGTTAVDASIEGSVLTAIGTGVIRVRARTANFVGEPFYIMVV